MPRTSLMMRELTFFSSAYGSHAKFTDFVLEQVAQRLRQLQAQFGGQAAKDGDETGHR